MNTQKLQLFGGITQMVAALILLLTSENKTTGLIFMSTGVLFTALAAQNGQKK